jgi:hypothetical protein
MSTNPVSSVDLGESLTQLRFLPIFEYLMRMRGRDYIHVAHIPINKVSELPRGQYSQRSCMHSGHAGGHLTQRQYVVVVSKMVSEVIFASETLVQPALGKLAVE